MSTFLLGCIILISILILYIIINDKHDKFSIENNILYKSSSDGNTYYVHGLHEDLKEAANVFSKINSDISNFLEKLYYKYKNSSNHKRKEISKLMFKRFSKDALRESSPLNPEKDTSFTINKGDIIAICIRDGYSYGIQDYNIIMFVVLHELTHLAIESYDHPDEFWVAFRFVLTEAVNDNIYNPVDYASNPIDYCGIIVNYSPLYDNTLELI